MKNEKGITLVALILYIVVFSTVLTLLTLLTTNIYGNLDKINTNSVSSAEFNKFNVNFIKDVKASNKVDITTTNNDVKILLTNGANYNYVKDEKSIYRNKVKIAQNIFQFQADSLIENNKNIVKVTIGTGKNDIDFGKTIKYVLKYW